MPSKKTKLQLYADECFPVPAEYAERIFGKKVEVLTPQSLSPHIAPHLKDEVSYVQI